jgi:hypothetical protein
VLWVNSEANRRFVKNLAALAEREYRAHTLWKSQHRGWLIC